MTAALAQQVVAQPVDQHDHRPAGRGPARAGHRRARRVRHAEAAATAGRTPASPVASYAGGRQAVVERGDAQRPMLADSSRAKVMAWPRAASPSASALIRRRDVVGGDGALVAVVGLAPRVATGGRDQVDAADRTPARW